MSERSELVAFCLLRAASVLRAATGKSLVLMVKNLMVDYANSDMGIYSSTVPKLDDRLKRTCTLF